MVAALSVYLRGQSLCRHFNNWLITAIVRLAFPLTCHFHLGPACERAGGVEFQLRLSEFVARLQAPNGFCPSHQPRTNTKSLKA
jgi:hypothetical protein